MDPIKSLNRLKARFCNKLKSNRYKNGKLDLLAWTIGWFFPSNEPLSLLRLNLYNWLQTGLHSCVCIYILIQSHIWIPRIVTNSNEPFLAAAKSGSAWNSPNTKWLKVHLNSFVICERLQSVPGTIFHFSLQSKFALP